MTMIYSEEQRLLKDSVHEMLTEMSPISAQRRLRDEPVQECFDTELWQSIIDMGWTAIPFPEEFEGLDFGNIGLGIVFEQIGANLSANPLLSSVVLAGSAILLGGTEEQQKSLLPELISGQKRYALATDEAVHHNPAQISLNAVEDEEGFRISGEKIFVVDAIDADGLIVAVRTGASVGEEKAISLFLVDLAEARGVNIVPQSTIDARNVARIQFEDVLVPHDALIGNLHQGADLLQQVLDRGRACLAAELLGMAQWLFETTNEYLKTRIQFDVPIGSFQALQHRMAWCYVDLELARSAVMSAFSALDNDNIDDNSTAQLVSLAKWKAGEAAHRIGNEAVQLHGGIGVTDELDVGLFLKRIRVAQALFGDSDYHVARYDSLGRT